MSYYQYHDEYQAFPEFLIEKTINHFNFEIENTLVEMRDLPRCKLNEESLKGYDFCEIGSLEGNLGLPDKLAFKNFNNLPYYCHSGVLPEVESWVKNNINKKCHVGIQCFFKGTFFYPHIDIGRARSINYLFDLGGDNVTTCFYEPKEEWKNHTISQRTYIPYERINLVQSVIFEKNRWHSLKSNSIHSVENIDIDKKRIALTLSFNV